MDERGVRTKKKEKNPIPVRYFQGSSLAFMDERGVRRKKRKTKKT
jgi:hypothetical protein